MTAKSKSVPAIDRAPAPEIGESLSARLKSMQRQVSTVASTGGGLGSSELERLAEELREMAGIARSAEEAQPARPNFNARTLEAHMRLSDAQGAIEQAANGLRKRMKEVDPDPDGMILASVRSGEALLASAEAILLGRMPS